MTTTSAQKKKKKERKKACNTKHMDRTIAFQIIFIFQKQLSASRVHFFCFRGCVIVFGD